MKKLSKRSRGLILFGIALGCFALLGFVSQITAPLTQNFDKALFIDSLHSVDLRPNLYAILTVMTLPAALLARYFGIRACLLMGMCLFSGGALSTLPAGQVGTAGPLAIGITFIYSGLAFIDTAAMTMMVTYGERQKSYGRILVGKTFEMAGWAVGLCATTFIFSPRSITPEMGSGTLSESLFAEAAQRADLMTAATPFIWVGAVACVMVFISALQEANDSTPDPALKYKLVGIAKKLSKDKTYLFGAAALAVYLMTQVFCWHNIVGLSTAAEMSEAGDTPPHKASGHATADSDTLRVSEKEQPAQTAAVGLLRGVGIDAGERLRAVQRRQVARSPGHDRYVAHLPDDSGADDPPLGPRDGGRGHAPGRDEQLRRPAGVAGQQTRGPRQPADNGNLGRHTRRHSRLRRLAGQEQAQARAQ